MKKFVTNSIDIVTDQYHHLIKRFLVTNDSGEKKILLRRLANLVTVLEFLYTTQHIGSRANNFMQ